VTAPRATMRRMRTPKSPRTRMISQRTMNGEEVNTATFQKKTNDKAMEKM
jgi:hypothetical protein